MTTHAVALLVMTLGNSVPADDSGYQKEVTVREATRLDWVFAVSNQSVTNPPAEWLEGYDSAKQRYEVFVPAVAKGEPTRPKPKSKAKRKDAEPEGLPLVLFISAGDQPAGWSQLQAVCQQRGIVFASPYGAGNNTSMPNAFGSCSMCWTTCGGGTRSTRIGRISLGSLAVVESPAASHSPCPNSLVE